MEEKYNETLEKIKKKKRVPLLRIIRLKCLDCMGFQINEVKLCPSKDCICHSYRMGKNPVKRIMSDKQKAVLSKALENHRHNARLARGALKNQ